LARAIAGIRAGTSVVVGIDVVGIFLSSACEVWGEAPAGAGAAGDWVLLGVSDVEWKR